MSAKIITPGTCKVSPNLTSHLYTYVRDTCKFSIYSDAPVVCMWGNPRPGPRRSTPIDFSVRGFINGVFICFGFFRTNVHGKQGLGLLYHKIGSGWPIARVFHIQIRDFTKCLPMSAKSVTPGTCKVSPTLHHTCTHMLGTHASFRAIPTFRWSLSG